MVQQVSPTVTKKRSINVGTSWGDEEMSCNLDLDLEGISATVQVVVKKPLTSKCKKYGLIIFFTISSVYGGYSLRPKVAPFFAETTTADIHHERGNKQSE